MGIGAEAVERCELWARPPFSEDSHALTRRYLTDAHRAAVRRLSIWMAAAGMQVQLDAAGTLIGRYEGTGPGKTLLIGSHIDSVSDAGAYDGALGVMLGLGCIAHLAKTGRRLPFAIELLAFGDEEGSRFPAAMIGSRALAGILREDVTRYVDADGVDLGQAMQDFGLNPILLPQAARDAKEILLYFEPHIEQGPVLEAENLPVGVVTGIAAQTRLLVRLEGVAAHTGTTPMHLRHDALAAASEAILALERIAVASAGALVATAGRIEAFPGLSNVIPAKVNFSVDLRAPLAGPRDAAEQEFRTELAAICARRGIGCKIEVAHRLAPCFCDPAAQQLLTAAIAAQGVTPRYLASGAGHDAMNVAALAPVAMLFIRCKGGISHNPAEHVTPEDAEIAAQTMLGFIEKLAENKGSLLS